MALEVTERFVKLEDKVSYQDKLISDLNEVVVDLNQTVRELRLRVEALEAVLQAEFQARDMPHEKPPHY